jgi:hypothetical protein
MARMTTDDRQAARGGGCSRMAAVDLDACGLPTSAVVITPKVVSRAASCSQRPDPATAVIRGSPRPLAAVASP